MNWHDFRIGLLFTVNIWWTVHVSILEERWGTMLCKYTTVPYFPYPIHFMIHAIDSLVTTIWKTPTYWKTRTDFANSVISPASLRHVCFSKNAVEFHINLYYKKKLPTIHRTKKIWLKTIFWLSHGVWRSRNPATVLQRRCVECRDLVIFQASNMLITNRETANIFLRKK